MSQLTRTGDIGVGICSGHKVPIPMTGTIVASATKVMIDNLPAGLTGDIVLGNCGHTGVIIASTSVCIAEGRSVARVGDSFTGIFSGTIISGSSKTTSK